MTRVVIIPCLSIFTLFAFNKRNLCLRKLKKLLNFIFFFLPGRNYSLSVFVVILRVSVLAMGKSDLFPECSALRFIFQNGIILSNNPSELTCK